MAADRGRDTVTRDLTPAEQAEAASLRGALAAWEAYLSRVQAVGTLDEAVAKGAPLARVTRESAATSDPFAGSVSPAFLSPTLAWAALRRLPVPLDRSVSPTTLTDALLFLGCRPASTVRGRDEVDRRSPHRSRAVDGWYRAEREHVKRLRFFEPVPVLTALRGRPKAVAADATGAQLRTWERRAALRADVGAVRRLLADYVTSTPATALLEVARVEGRPLVTRKGGRPRSAFHRDSGTVRGSVLVRVSALAAFTATDGHRLGVPELTEGTTRAALAAVSRSWPGLIEPARAFSTHDSNGQVQQRRAWVRVLLDPLGLPEVEDQPLRNELAVWAADGVRRRAFERVSEGEIDDLYGG